MVFSTYNLIKCSPISNHGTSLLQFYRQLILVTTTLTVLLILTVFVIYILTIYSPKDGRTYTVVAKHINIRFK